MNTLTFAGLLGCLGLALCAPAGPSATDSLEQQLTGLLSYPEALNQTARAGVVVVRFEVDKRQRIHHLDVLSAHEGLKADLTRQLLGRRVKLKGTTGQEYTLRLHFRPE